MSTPNKSYLKVSNDLYIDLEKAIKESEDTSNKYIKKFSKKLRLFKAKPTKYIKRIPKASGKGYTYIYKEEGGKKGGLLSGILSFFGLKDEKQVKEKIKSEYNKNKDKLEGISQDTFASHLNEYLSNKDKWDKKLSGKEKKAPAKKAPTKKVDKKTGKIVKKDKTVGFDLSVMRTIAGIYGKDKEKEEKKDKFSQDGKLFESDGKTELKVYNKTTADLIVKKYKQEGIDLKPVRDRTGDYSFEKIQKDDKKTVMSEKKESVSDILKTQKYDNPKYKQANAADLLGNRFSMNKDNIFNWAEKHNLKLIDFIGRITPEKFIDAVSNDKKINPMTKEEYKKSKNKEKQETLTEKEERLRKEKEKRDKKPKKLQKAKKPAPVGTVSGKYKKTADGKWVRIKEDGKKPKTTDGKEEENGKKPEEKPKVKKEHKGIIKNALKRVANILADALSGRDVVQPTGEAVEQAGESAKSKTPIKKEEKK
jgi:hypothetical protein